MSSFRLSDILNIESAESGHILNHRQLISVSRAFQKVLFKHLNENLGFLFPEKKKIQAVFYTMTQLPKDPNVQLFSLWNFSAKKVNEKRENWCIENDLSPKNCCRRNKVRRVAEKYPNLNSIDEIPELNNFCLFHPSSIKLNVYYYAHLLNPLYAKKDFNYLDIRLNNLTTNTQYCLIPNESKFYSITPQVNSERIENRVLKKLLKKLIMNFFSNLNCKDLLLDLDLEGPNFSTFLYNCLLICYLNQQWIKPNKQENIKQVLKV